MSCASKLAILPIAMYVEGTTMHYIGQIVLLTCLSVHICYRRLNTSAGMS